MYKVLLVDDEPWSLISLKNSFHWENHGFVIAASTTNPLEAYEILRTDAIDVTFLDIRMPDVSGFDLIKLAKDEGIKTEFVLVSGFADFHYAQQAIKEGVFDYCLKPVDEDKTDELLIRLSEKLKLKYQSGDAALIEKLMDDCPNVQDLLLERGFKNSYRYFQVIAYSRTVDTELDIQNLINEKRHTTFFLHGGEKKLFLLLNSENILFKDEATTLSLPQLRALKGCMGLSSISEDIQDIPRLLKESNIAVNQKFIDASLQVFLYVKPSYDTVNGILENIFTQLDFLNLKNLKMLMSQVPTLFSQNHLGLEDAAYFQNQIIAYITRRLKNSKFIVEPEFMNCDDIFNRFGTIASMCDSLYELFIDINKSTFDSESDQNVNISVNRLIDYVNENYNQELYLKELSATYHLNFTYCSELFKKVTGSSFSQYVTGLRMKKASEMLLNTNLSLEKICRETGYVDYYYFYSVFKKHFNVSPSKYRKSI